jgi:mitosis inhibitor protein kinase SWE1
VHFDSPKTPKDNIVPPDPSSLSISGKSYKRNPLRGSVPPMPVTPARDGPHFKSVGVSSPLFPDGALTEDGMSLYSKFAEVKHIGTGQFSEVYRVTERVERQHGLFTPGRSSASGFSSSPAQHEPAVPQVYAVKKAKNKFLGPRDRRERMAEVQILRDLANHEHVISYVDHWTDDGGHLCIQTEFCDNGSLDRFLEQHGTKGRLDEFRVWKMLLELCLVCRSVFFLGYEFTNLL